MNVLQIFSILQCPVGIEYLEMREMPLEPLAPRRNEQGQSWHQPVEEAKHVREQLGRFWIPPCRNSDLKSWRLPPRIKPIWEIVAISAAQKQLGKPNFARCFDCYILLETLDASKDCTVGDWSAWDLCSVSCGTGTTTRKRSVTKQQALWLELLNCLYLLQVVNPLRLYCMSLLADLSLTRHLVVLHVRISPRHIPAIQVTFAPRPILDLCASHIPTYSNCGQIILWYTVQSTQRLLLPLSGMVKFTCSFCLLYLNLDLLSAKSFERNHFNPCMSKFPTRPNTCLSIE